ncbi:MAG TPA: hypothetical protein VF763_05485 [Candidatus Limnocylindrales bacterium]
MDQRRPVPSRAALARGEGGRRRSLSPGPVILVLAAVGSVLFVVYAATVRDPSQIPLLSAGSAVLGIVFAALTIVAASATYRAGRVGRPGRALAMALSGGVAGIIACGAFGAAVILALLAGR